MAENKKKIQIWVTPKQYQFIKFLNNNFQFGKLELLIHNSEPEKAFVKEIEKPFNENIKLPIDTFSGDKVE